ncbi:MAG: ATP-binding protein, partial [bacterium]
MVTVLFADIVGSSRFVLGSDPELANGNLSPILEAMTETIGSCGGTVLQVLGDGVLAVFGAPRALEDHALRACHAAEQMHRRVLAVPTTGGSRSGRVPRLRIGVDAGEVLVVAGEGGLGSETRVIGEPVYAASRLQKAARPGMTLGTINVANLTMGAVTTKKWGRVALGSGSTRVEALVLRDVGGPRIRTNSGGSSIGLPFVGRNSVFGDLLQSMHDALAGAGCAVHVSGEPGVGKTRLLCELLATTGGGTFQVVRHAITAEGLYRRLEPTSHFIVDLLGLRTGDGRLPEASAVEARMAALALSGSAEETTILRALGLRRGRGASEDVGPQERLSDLTSAITRVAIHSSRVQPLVICIDDFHWADHGMCHALWALITTCRHERLFLLIASRDPCSDGRLGHSVRAVRLHALDSDSAVNLASAAALPLRMSDEALRTLVERSGGNPFFLLECTRDLRARFAPGMTVRREDVDHGLPLSVHAVLASRIDRLERVQREVLFAASAIGETFDVRLLEDLVPRELRREVRSALQHLANLGFVRETRILPRLEYTFDHALVREVSYGTLPRSVRLRLHDQLLRLIRS